MRIRKRKTAFVVPRHKLNPQDRTESRSADEALAGKLTLPPSWR
jgi:hypothetical protein